MMLSTAFTRCFVRSSTTSTPWAARALSSSTSLSLGFPSSVDPTVLKWSNNYATSGSLLFPRPEVTTRSIQQPVSFPILQQHPATPVFMGFAAVSKVDPMTCVETLEEEGRDNTVISNGGWIFGFGNNLDEDKETLQMLNRNARSSIRHKANHGKRPCNRNARRAKKIKLGRRRRT